jgi:hypothetical protein
LSSHALSSYTFSSELGKFLPSIALSQWKVLWALRHLLSTPQILHHNPLVRALLVMVYDAAVLAVAIELNAMTLAIPETLEVRFDLLQLNKLWKWGMHVP